MAKSVGRRGYNAYLRKAKRKFGITHTQARAMYRLQSAHAGEPINSRSIDIHPRLAKRFAASKPTRTKPKSKGSVQRGPKSGKEPAKGGGSVRGKGPEAPPKRPRTIRQWEQYYDDGDEYEDLILNAGVDTGRGKGKR